MKKYLVLILALFLTPTLYGQCVGHCTTVTATLTDTSTQIWANAIVQTVIVPPFGNPSPLLNTGLPIAEPHSTFAADGSGFFTISLDDNSLLAPAGSMWKFILCPNATVANCTIVQLGISGGTMDISAQLNAALVLITVNVVPTVYRTYIDGQAFGGQGAIYWRVTDNTLRGCMLVICPGTGWIPIGGGGGGGGITSITAGLGLSATPTNPITSIGTIFLADTTVVPGPYTNPNLTVNQQGQITTISNGSPPAGTICAALQFAAAYYDQPGTTNSICGIPPATAPNGVPQMEVWIPAGGVATIPQIVKPGLTNRAVTGSTSTDTVVSTDCNPKRLLYNTSVSVAVTLPTATTLAIPNCTFKVANGSTGSSTTVTVTPTTWTIKNGGATPGSSLVLQQGQEALISVDSSGTNWNADVVEMGLTAGSNITFTRSSSGLSIASTGGATIKHAIAFNIGSPGGSALTGASTDTSYVTVPFTCTLDSYDLILQPSGTVTVKFWKVASGTAAPVVGNSISTSGVGISSGTSVHSTTMSDFTSVAVTAYDRMAMNVTAVSTASFVNGVLRCSE